MERPGLTERHFNSIPTYVTRELAAYLYSNPELAFNPEFIKDIFDEINKQRATFQKNREQNAKVAMEVSLNAIDRSQKSSKRTKKSAVSCRRGCSFCCHINVHMSNAEAQIISEFCQQQGIEISRQYLHAQLVVPEPAFAASNVSRCVFLKNNECQVYPVRPIACRRYFVDSDPKYCNAKQYPSSPNVRSVSDLGLEVFLSAIFPVLANETSRMPAMLLPYST